MFVFRREDLPADPFFPADLEKLGYFINENDQIRKISAPDKGFQFKINRNPRWNELHREAMNACVREIVYSRLRDLGLATLHLPLYSSPTDPHVPIFVSRNLSTAKRVIVVFGEPVQDLGIWAYRTVGCESISAGSAVSFARAVLMGRHDDLGLEAKELEGETPALLLANTGQLVWNCFSRRAMTLPSWFALPRESAVDPPPVMTKRNKIAGNTDWQEHVNSIFDNILAARSKFISYDAKIDIIGLAEGGLAAVRYLSQNWNFWRPHISAICLGNPLHSVKVDLADDDEGPSSFRAFLSSRCRAYLLSDLTLGIPMTATEKYGSNCYSSSESLNVECIMPQAWRPILEWLTAAYENPDYCEEVLEMKEFGPDETIGNESPLERAEGEAADDSRVIDTSSLCHMRSENGASFSEFDNSEGERDEVRGIMERNIS